MPWSFVYFGRPNINSRVSSAWGGDGFLVQLCDPSALDVLCDMLCNVLCDMLALAVHHSSGHAVCIWSRRIDLYLVPSLYYLFLSVILSFCHSVILPF